MFNVFLNDRCVRRNVSFEIAREFCLHKQARRTKYTIRRA